MSIESLEKYNELEDAYREVELILEDYIEMMYESGASYSDIVKKIIQLVKSASKGNIQLS